MCCIKKIYLFSVKDDRWKNDKILKDFYQELLLVILKWYLDMERLMGVKFNIKILKLFNNKY